ncbi:MAG TPA: DinB family protein [Aequorivita sp.]|nr:DinB family protein [Aequorivita sp.]
MNTELLNRFDTATKNLMQQLSSLNDEQLNAVPFKGSWTAGQLGNHLYKSYNIMDVLNGNVKETHRNPVAKLAEIEKTFKDFTIKMESPEMVLPTTEHIEKERLLSSLKERIEPQREAIKTMDLSKTCLDAEIPGAGPFIRQEWLGFNTIHTERHNHQLKNIIDAL